MINKRIRIAVNGYGVRPEHYDTVAAALIWTLEKGLGEAFTPEVKDAWVAVYTLLAQTMKDAAASIKPEPSRVMTPA